MRMNAEAFVLAAVDNALPWQRLILLDANWEYQGPQEQGTNLWRSENTRDVMIVDYLPRRLEFLQQVGMGPICNQPSWICTLAVRGRPWNDDNERRQIWGGDYAEVTIRRRPISTPPALVVTPVHRDCDRSLSPERPRELESRPSIETERTEESSSVGNQTDEVQSDEEPDHAAMMHLPLEVDEREATRDKILIYPHRLPEPIQDLGLRTNLQRVQENVKQRMRKFGVIKEGDEIIFHEIQLQPEDLRLERIWGYVTSPKADVQIWQEVILLEVIFEGSAEREESSPRRTVKIVDYSLYQQAGLAPFCVRDGKTCRTIVGGKLWDSSKLLRLFGGDYVQVYIQECHEDIPTSVQLRMAHEGCRYEDMYKRARITQKTSENRRGGSNNPTEKSDENDHTDLMQRRLPTEWFFIYLKGSNEPIAEGLQGNDVQDPVLALRNRYATNSPDVPRNFLMMFYIVPQPHDLEMIKTTGIIHALANEIPQGKSLTLTDYEFYENGKPRAREKPFAINEWREVKEVTSYQDRESFLREIGLHPFCYSRKAICFLTHRGTMWNVQDHEKRHIRDGDYILVKVKKEDRKRSVKEQWRSIHGECQLDEASEYNKRLMRRDRLQHEGPSTDEEDIHRQDNVSLLQLWRPSFARFAWKHLPPPGNGTKKVKFSNQVNFMESNETKIDMAIENEFIESFCGEQEDADNPFTEAMRLEMRYETRKNQQPSQCEWKEKQTISIAENLSEAYLPIKSEENDNVAGISFGKVRSFHDWLDQHTTLPDYGVDGIAWKDASLEWVQSPIFFGSPADEYHFYTDGSKQGANAASAIVLFCKRQGKWFFGGYATNLNEGFPSSFTAELKAIIMALKWTWDICKVQGIYGANHKFHYHYDAQAAGNIAFGTQNCMGHEQLYYAVRGMAYYVRERFGIELEGHYVPGHANDPGNEAADVLANRTAKDRLRQRPFWNALLGVKEYKLFAWLWFLFRKDVEPYFQGDFLKIPRPTAIFSQNVVKQMNPRLQKGTGEWQEFQIRFVTLNALTMGNKRDRNRSEMGPTKLDALCYQMHELGIQIFALQETRIRHKLAKHDLYTFLQVDANKKGQGGLLLAVSTSIAYTTRKDGSRKYFGEADLRLLAKEDNYLVAKLTTDFGPFIVAVAHAPHSGNTDLHLAEWWDKFSKVLRSSSRTGSLFLLGDFNSRVGEFPSEEIDEHGAEPENVNGTHFKQLLTEMGCFAPSTFNNFHEGTTKTWRHPGGAESRLDYVVLPTEWKGHEIRSRVLHEVAVSDCIHDHSAAAGRMRSRLGEFERQGARHVCPEIYSTMENKQECVMAIGKELQSTDWEMDVHTHTGVLYQRLQKASRKHIPTMPWIRKSYLTWETWDAICNKRTARKKVYKLLQEEKTSNLRDVFDAWKTGRHQHRRASEILESFKAIAKAEWEFRKANLEANRLNRRDDKIFFDDLAKRIVDCDSPSLQNQLWKAIRRLLPKYRVRKNTMNSAKLASLDGEWLPHLCQLEAGEALDKEEIYKRCIDTHNREVECQPALDDLPDVVSVEKTLRKSQPGRAPGADGLQASWLHYGAHVFAKPCFDLYMKSALWSTEPVQFKGGMVTMLEKAPGVREVNKFRSIVLMGALAKRFHALSREKLINVLNKNRTEGQIGGFAHQEVMYGSLAVRTFTRISYGKGKPTATMFFDLTAAYHGLIRQGVVGGEHTDLASLATLAKTLAREGQDPDEVLQVLDQPGYLCELGVPEYLIRQLAEYHENTWTCVKGEAALTNRGSRPGSPLADAMFLAEMSGILWDIEEYVQSYRSCQIAWADDLAISIQAESNEQLEEDIKEVTCYVNERFSRRGMRLNFSKGKTEIVMSNRGEGAGKKRTELLQMEKPAIQVELHTGKSVPVLCVGCYKHLGTWTECGGRLEVEIKRRIGTAWATFQMLRRPLLCNKQLKLQTRIRLFEALVMTKMLFGCGAWYVIPGKLLKKLHVAYLKMLRAIAGQLYRPQAEHPKTDEEVLGMLLLPGVRVRIAKDRLLFARRLHLHGPAFLQNLIREEEEAANNSWWTGVKADFRWLQEVKGDRSWGDSVEDAIQHWKNGKAGWKNYIQKSVERHVLQEELARQILKKDPKTGDPNGQDGDHVWECKCGKKFLSRTACAVHQRIVHNVHSEEYLLACGTQCLVCLRELWTEQRLRAHLNYKPRNGKPNRCFGMYKADRELLGNDQIEEKADKKDVPMPGLRRRESVQHCGPLRCGARASDVQFVKDELNSCLDALACKEFSGDFSRHVDQSMLATLDNINDEEEDAVERWCMALEGRRNDIDGTVTFLVWGMKHQWSEESMKVQWEEILVEQHLGRPLQICYEKMRQYLFLQEVETMSCERKVQQKAANERERLARDAEIERKADQLRGRRDVLSALVVSSHLSNRQLRSKLA